MTQVPRSLWQRLRRAIEAGLAHQAEALYAVYSDIDGGYPEAQLFAVLRGMVAGLTADLWPQGLDAEALDRVAKEARLATQGWCNVDETMFRGVLEMVLGDSSVSAYIPGNLGALAMIVLVAFLLGQTADPAEELDFYGELATGSFEASSD